MTSISALIFQGSWANLDLCSASHQHSTGSGQSVCELWSHGCTTVSQILQKNTWTWKWIGASLHSWQENSQRCLRGVHFYSWNSANMQNVVKCTLYIWRRDFLRIAWSSSGLEHNLGQFLLYFFRNCQQNGLLNMRVRVYTNYKYLSRIELQTIKSGYLCTYF
jgi:hypothetical protein